MLKRQTVVRWKRTTSRGLRLSSAAWWRPAKVLKATKELATSDHFAVRQKMSWQPCQYRLYEWPVRNATRKVTAIVSPVKARTLR